MTKEFPDALVASLRAQLDEDERITRACQDEVGQLRIGQPYEDGSGIAEIDDYPSYPWGSLEAELAFAAGPGHPDRVLAEIARKRRILELHALDVHYAEGGAEGEAVEVGRYCKVCIADFREPAHGDDPTCYHGQVDYPCAMVRLLAACVTE